MNNVQIDQSILVKKYFKLNKLLDTNALNSKNFICGIEYEIEDIRNIDSKINNFFLVKPDDSLRNNGREFITFPEYFEAQLELFSFLHKNLHLGEKAFTDRTSIHVHVNVRNLSLFEVKQFLLLYVLLEPLFFDFVGPIRKGSIFCLPLNYTFLPSLYHKNIPQLWQKWHKYTAFNILPLGQQLGTIEFRHMYGTNSFDKFSIWLSSIKSLYDFIINNNEFNLIEEIENSKSPSVFAKQVVPLFANKYEDFQLNNMMLDSLLDIKLSTGGLGES